MSSFTLTPPSSPRTSTSSSSSNGSDFDSPLRTPPSTPPSTAKTIQASSSVFRSPAPPRTPPRGLTQRDFSPQAYHRTSQHSPTTPLRPPETPVFNRRPPTATRPPVIVTAELRHSQVMESIQSGKPFSLDENTQIQPIYWGKGVYSRSGEHSDAFLCVVNGKNYCVLKIFKENLLKNKPGRVTSSISNQLKQYRKSKKEKLPIAINYTFENSQADSRDQVVKQCPELATWLVELIPHDFPKVFDPNNSQWQQLKTLFATCFTKNFPIDLQYDNVKVADDGTVKLIECNDQEEEGFDYMIDKYLGTFDPAARSFLDPRPSASPT